MKLFKLFKKKEEKKEEKKEPENKVTGWAAGSPYGLIMESISMHQNNLNGFSAPTHIAVDGVVYKRVDRPTISTEYDKEETK